MNLQETIEALREAGFPIVDPDYEVPVPTCHCGCGLFSHRHSGASVCVNSRTCKCTGWYPKRRRAA